MTGCRFENPVICTTCSESLRGYFNFIKNCMDMADKIEYSEIEESSNEPQVKSNCVVQIKTENESNDGSDYASRGIQKNQTENELYDETDLKFDYPLHLGSQELYMKHEHNESKVGTLSNLLQSTMTNMLNCKNNYVDTIIVKKCQEDEQNSEPEIKCEHLVQAESHKCNIKHEEIHIKAEDENEDSSGVAVYSCGLCTYKAKGKDTLEQHILTHKNASNDPATYSCYICAFITKQKSYIKRHMLIHKNISEVTMYPCGTCTFKTSRKHNLTSHMLIHKNISEVATYQCDVCTFKTKRNKDLKRHTLIHKDGAEVKTYQCDICAFKTTRRWSLKQHRLVHKSPSEVTMYSCGVCTHKTRRKSNLKRHIMSIHKKSPETTLC